MKILLVNPPIPESYYNREYYLPSGLLYVAAVLLKNGEQVKILDMKTLYKKAEKFDNPDKFYEDILVDTISNFQPTLIGFGCLYSGNFPDLLQFTELTKGKFKEIFIVTGGIHPTIYPNEILSNCHSIDGIILGEGEESIIQFVDTFKNGRLKFDKVSGFAFRENGKVIINQRLRYIENLDSIPFPAYDLVDLKDYYVDTLGWFNPKKLPIKTSIPIITSRSCPNRCNFCSMYMVMGAGWRGRSPENVVDEIEYLYNKYNHRHFSFMDDNLTLRRAHILGICDEIIKRKLDIEFETPNGISPRTLDKEVLERMVSAGLVRISLAIESGSDFIRNKIMKKYLSRKKIFEIIQLTKKYKQLYVKAFFIIGMPEETQDTLIDTYNMIKEIDVDRVYLHNVVPFPGTEVFKQGLRDNLLVGINPNGLYKSDDLYITNYQRIFIKPYKLELKDLQEFRLKCENLLNKQKAGKIKQYDF